MLKNFYLISIYICLFSPILIDCQTDVIAEIEPYQFELKLWSHIRHDTTRILQECHTIIKSRNSPLPQKLNAYIGYTQYLIRHKNFSKAHTLAQFIVESAAKNHLGRHLFWGNLLLLNISYEQNKVYEMVSRIKEIETILKHYKLSDALLLVQFYEIQGLYQRKIQRNYEALKYFKQMLMVSQAAKLKFQEVQANFYVSWIYSEAEQSIKSVPYIDSAIHILEQYFPTEVADMYYEKSLVMLYQGKAQEAQDAILKAEVYYKKFDVFKGENQGMVANVKGDIFKQFKQYNAAEKEYLIAKKLLKSVVNIKYLYGSLTDFYERTEQFKLALVYQRKYLELKNTLFSNQFIQKANDYELKYEVSLKQKELEEKSQFYTFIFSVLSISFVIILGGGYLLLRNRSLKVDLAKKEILLKNIENELKERKLATNTLLVAQQNEIINEVGAKLNKLQKIVSTEKLKSELSEVNKFITQNQNTSEESWEKFKVHFDVVSPSFFTNLKQKFPHLTELDLKHCAYIKISFTPKQVANILGISPKSVTLSRVRIKKKLNLPLEVSLNDFLRDI